MKKNLCLLLFIKISTLTFCQFSSIEKKNDNIIFTESSKPFNGVILISKKGKTIYSKTNGYSNISLKTPLKLSDQYVIGSISKQFTAVLILKEFEKGNLNLHLPIHKYLPELSQSWADTITIHHLLTHMHGILELDKPTAFKAGTQFLYSQIGYDLLSKIIEKITNQSFAELSKKLFEECNMKNTFHPDNKEYNNLVKGYTENENNEIQLESNSLQNFVAAGSFISTAYDLNLWNEKLLNGKLLKRKTLKLLTTNQKGAIRNHPIFGITEYGYGITIDTKENILRYGQTGFVPGFVSMCFYLPKTKTSIIVLENIAYYSNDLKLTFKVHLEILEIVRNEIIK